MPLQVQMCSSKPHLVQTIEESVIQKFCAYRLRNRSCLTLAVAVKLSVASCLSSWDVQLGDFDIRNPLCGVVVRGIACDMHGAVYVTSPYNAVYAWWYTGVCFYMMHILSKLRSPERLISPDFCWHATLPFRIICILWNTLVLQNINSAVRRAFW